MSEADCNNSSHLSVYDPADAYRPIEYIQRWQYRSIRRQPPPDTAVWSMDSPMRGCRAPWTGGYVLLLLCMYIDYIIKKKIEKNGRNSSLQSVRDTPIADRS